MFKRFHFHNFTFTGRYDFFGFPIRVCGCGKRKTVSAWHI